MPVVFTLVLALLTVESSYSGNIERPATRVPDSVQFWLAPDADWRIRTLAIDHDIHVHQIGKRPERSPLSAEDAAMNIRKHYGDVIDRIVVLTFLDLHDAASVTSALRVEGLAGRLEIGPNGLAFYNPDGGHYRTRSQPKP